MAHPQATHPVALDYMMPPFYPPGEPSRRL